MEEFNRAGGRRAGVMQHVLLRYTQALITQISQTTVCNLHHSLEQHLCRWLLLTLDRLPSNELIPTQELIATSSGCGVKASPRPPGICNKRGAFATAAVTSPCLTGRPGVPRV